MPRWTIFRGSWAAAAWVLAACVLCVASPTWAAGTYGGQAAENASRLLSRLLVQEVARAEQVSVVSKAELEQAMSLASDRAIAQCSDTSCITAVAEQLESRFVVYGEVALVEDTLTLALTLFDSVEGRGAARELVRGGTLSELARALPAAASRLVESLEGALRSTDARDEQANEQPARVLVLDITAAASSFPAPRGGMPPLQAGVMQTIGGAGLATLAMAPVGALAATTFVIAPAAPAIVGVGLLAALAGSVACSPFLCPAWSVLGAAAAVFAGDYLGHLDGSIVWPTLTAGLLWLPLVAAPLAASLVGAFFVPFTEDGSGLLATVGIAGLGVVVAVLGLIVAQAAGVAVYHLTATPAEPDGRISAVAMSTREFPPPELEQRLGQTRLAVPY